MKQIGSNNVAIVSGIGPVSTIVQAHFILGEKIFTEGKSFKNLQLKPGGTVSFRYRIIIDEGRNKISAEQLNQSADEFAKLK